MPRYESPYDPAKAPKDLDHVTYRKQGHVAYVTINRFTFDVNPVKVSADGIAAVDGLLVID